jgi:AraC family transcriptional regulator
LVARLDEPLTLEEIARKSGYSSFHFHRLFRGIVGEPVTSLLRRLRLERAAMVLHRDRDRPITMIGLDAGYETHESFTRAFVGAFGRSPSAFRRQRISCVWLDGASKIHMNMTGHVDIPEELWNPSNKETAMELRIEDRSPQRIAYLAGRGPYQKVLPESFARLCEVAQRRGLFARPGAVTLAVCHDDPETTPADQIRSEAAITVDDSFDGEGEIKVRMLTGGRYAIATHLGPYSGLTAAWQTFVGTLIPAAQVKFREGDCFEVYVNDPSRVKPTEIRTEMYMPIE